MTHELVAQLRTRSALLQHEARLEGDEPFTSELLDAAADEIERPEQSDDEDGFLRVNLRGDDRATAAQKIIELIECYMSTMDGGESAEEFRLEIMARLAGTE